MVVHAIEKRGLRVNGRWEKKGYKLNSGDTVSIERLLEKGDWKVKASPDIGISVIHEETALLVINKPSGMPVHPIDPSETDTVINGLLAVYPALAAVGSNPLFPAIVHRLDTETSGVMLVARDQNTYDYLRRQFREKKVHKKYIALVCSGINKGGRLEHRLIHSASGSHRMLIAEESGQKAMMAITEYSVRESFFQHTLLDVVIRTGVTHQIRCQLAHIGYPIAGDSLYGSKEADAEYKGRMFLHAAEISFSDPGTGSERIYTADLPDDLRQALSTVKKQTLQ